MKEFVNGMVYDKPEEFAIIPELKINQEVWFMYNNKACSGLIFCIAPGKITLVNGHLSVAATSYAVKNHHWVERKHVFLSKDELINSLL